MAVTAHTGSFLIRPDIGLKIDGRGADVLVDTDTVGRFDLSTAETALLRDVSAVAARIPRETELLDALRNLGHDGQDAGAILDMLVDNGLAVRYGAAISVEKAARICVWTSHIDAIAARLQASPVLLIGDDAMRAHMVDEISGWGVHVQVREGRFPSPETSAVPAEPPPSLIVSLHHDAVELESLARWCDSRRVPLLPVRKTAQAMLVGPLFIPGVSPCPLCASAPGGSVPAHAADRSGPDRNETIGLVAELVVDCLALRPGADSLFQIHEFGSDGRWRGAYPAYGNPRCPVCSRLNRYPENAVIHG